MFRLDHAAAFLSPPAGQLFFEPLELHLEFADLGVELLLALLRGECIGVGLFGEDLRQPLGYLLLSLVDLRRMHPMLGGDGVDRIDVLERFQPDLGLQRGTMLASFAGHGGRFLSFGL
jgi:hypothetical protein